MINRSNEEFKSDLLIVEDKILTYESPFHEVAQYLAKKYLLIPYPEEKSERKIKRFYHGATHAACATYLADNAKVANGTLKYVDTENKEYHGGLFIELLKLFLPLRYWDIIKELNGGEDLTEVDFTLLKYAIFCHDMANTSECFADEQAHAVIYTQEMLQLGFKAERVKKFAEAMANKDAKRNKNILQMIIHDADCLEVTRVISQAKMFKIDELDIVKLFKKEMDARLLNIVLPAISEIAFNYHKLMNFIYKTDGNEVHEYCEFSENCYLATASLIQGYSFALRSIGLLPVDALLTINPQDYVDPLNLYRPSQNSFEVIYKYVFKDTTEVSDEKDDAVLQLYQTEGMYIRRLTKPGSETLVLKQNQRALAAKEIVTQEQLKSYFVKDEKSGEMKMLEGFKFRPATWIKKGIPIDTFQTTKVAFLIDPHAKSILASHFYKENVSSDKISKQFQFFRPSHIKDLTDFAKLNAKIAEIETQRNGYDWDNYNKRYARLFLQRNEILLSYDLSAVLGIVIGENKEAAEQAIMLWQFCHLSLGKSLNFYFYDIRILGLKKVSREEVLWWAGARKPNAHFPYRYDLQNLTRELEPRNVFFPSEKDSYNNLSQSSSATITTIRCSLANFDPSPEHPITYSFVCDGKQNLAYVKKGVPVIEVEGKAYYDAKAFIPTIVKWHQQRLIEHCNDLLAEFSKEVTHLLNIRSLYLSYAKDVRGKNYLQLSYVPVANKAIAKPELILTFIGYIRPDLAKSWKWEMQMSPNKNYNYIRLSVLQSVDAIHNQLTRLFVKPKPPISPKLGF